jgi:hypothetical protein
MNVPTVSAVDPNAGLQQSTEMSKFVRTAQDLQNKHINTGTLGAITDALHRSTLNVDEQFKRVVVSDDESFARAGALLKVVKDLLVQTEIERKNYTQPILAVKAAVDDIFKASATTVLAAVKVGLEAKMLAYSNEKGTVESHGVTTRVIKRKVTNVVDLIALLHYLSDYVPINETAGIIQVDTHALAALRSRLGFDPPGTVTVETDTIRNY